MTNLTPVEVAKLVALALVPIAMLMMALVTVCTMVATHRSRERTACYLAGGDDALTRCNTRNWFDDAVERMNSDE